MKIFFLLAFSVLIVSCGYHNDGIDVVVKNNTQSSIKEVKIYTWNSELELGEIASKSRSVGFLDMQNEPRVDGGYNLIFYDASDKGIIFGAGYYTLGRPLNRRVTFIVEPDTVKVEFSNFGRSFKGR